MTNEQQKAKQLAELLTAFADGKQLEYYFHPENEWRDIEDTESIILGINACYEIRIKPETKRIALNQQDLIDRVKENKTMWVKYEQFQCEYYLITSFSPLHVMFAGTEIDYDLLRVFGTFLDNTPCYKEVECEL